MAKRKIIISLVESNNAQAFDKNALLQYEAFEKVKNKISHMLGEKNNEIERVHNTIMINGARGTGKTSFLLSLAKHYKDDKEIKVLDIIDPTLIEDKQNIMISIVATIKETVDKVIESGNKDEKKYQSWLQSLRELACGLNLFEGVGGNPYNGDIWDDPTIIMEKGLSQASSGRSFEKNFHSYVKESLGTAPK